MPNSAAEEPACISWNLAEMDSFISRCAVAICDSSPPGGGAFGAAVSRVVPGWNGFAKAAGRNAGAASARANATSQRLHLAPVLHVTRSVPIVPQFSVLRGTSRAKLHAMPPLSAGSMPKGRAFAAR